MKSIEYEFLCIIFLLLAALREDLKACRIPNFLIVTGLGTSLAFHIAEHGITSILTWILAVFLPVFILFPLFAIRALGAGDIKLFSVIGGFYGTAFCIDSILFSFITAAVFSVISIIHKKQFRKRALIFKKFCIRIYLAGRQKDREKDWYHYDNGTEGVIHFSAAILAGFIITSLLTLCFPGFSFLSLLLP